MKNKERERYEDKGDNTCVSAEMEMDHEPYI